MQRCLSLLERLLWVSHVTTAHSSTVQVKVKRQSNAALHCCAMSKTCYDNADDNSYSPEQAQRSTRSWLFFRAGITPIRPPPSPQTASPLFSKCVERYKKSSYGLMLPKRGGAFYHHKPINEQPCLVCVHLRRNVGSQQVDLCQVGLHPLFHLEGDFGPSYGRPKVDLGTVGASSRLPRIFLQERALMQEIQKITLEGISGVSYMTKTPCTHV
jgi:hypothetical protein